MSAIKSIKGAAKCPCHSGQPYQACCRAYHRGDALPPTAEALMRSRFSAFALGEYAHLIRTLHPENSDRALPEDVLLATIQRACRDYKYTGLTVLETSAEGDHATVLFRAKVFQHGVDLSFSERSRFVRVDGAWLYKDGETMPRT